MKETLGTLKVVEVRSVWPSEARDFTPWLAANIGVLGNLLGMELEVVQIEAPVGDFSVDILAKDLSTGTMVIIENQFGPTDHDHLGKMLTYSSGFDANALVWIAESIRDEHRQALEWLNDRTDENTSAFAIELEVVRINDSPPAPNLKAVVVPNKWQKAAHAVGSSGPSEKGQSYRTYFQKLIDDLREKHHFTGARAAMPQNWYSFASGFSGLTYGFSFGQGNRVKVELYIDKGDANVNKKLFEWIQTKKQQVEQKLGVALEWERLEDRRSSRIALYRNGSISDNEQTLEEIREWAIKNLLSFKATFGELLKSAPMD